MRFLANDGLNFIVTGAVIWAVGYAMAGFTTKDPLGRLAIGGLAMVVGLIGLHLSGTPGF